MKRDLKFAITTTLALLAMANICSAANTAKKTTEAKYIFYFIGDGMAATQIRLAEAALSTPEFQQRYADLSSSKELKSELNIKSLNVTGLATTNAEDRYITDSAAAGTSLATGVKTLVGRISMDKDGNTIRTMAEMAHDKGMRVGIVSSVSLDHATPACFYAHSKSRNSYAEISNQILTSGFDYFAGGTVKWSQRASAERSDKAKAYAKFRRIAEERGYNFVATRSEFDAVNGSDNRAVIATLDMLANRQDTSDGSSMPYTIDLDKQSRADDKITLAEFTQKGIDVLDNRHGFFMMVEGGKIDWACHANDAATCAYEVVAFDDAIGVALNFAKRHPEETLIVVTGDHDCGGLAIGFAGTGYQSAFKLLALSNTSYTRFTAEAKKAIAQGADFEELLTLACERFGFTNDITDGSEGVINATAELSNYEVELLRSAYNKSASTNQKSAMSDADKYRASYSGYDPFTTTCTHILNNKSGVSFASYSHTAVPVMVFAHGAHDTLFSGYYDNTDIAKRIMQAGGLK